MILYNASTEDGLRNFARFLTNTDLDSYTDDELNAAINRYNRVFANKIIEAMDGWDFKGEIATTNLVANQQEYIFPSDILKFKRAEVSYDEGVTWRRLEIFDINKRRRPTDATTVNQEFHKTDPAVDVYDQSLFLYPIPTANSTSGLKIWYEKKVDDLSNDTDEPEFLEAYHPGLAHGAAVDYFRKYREIKANSSKANDNLIEMEKIIDNMQETYRTRIQDEEYSLQPQFVDYDYGNEY